MNVSVSRSTSPAAGAPIFAKDIPAELRSVARWVTWRHRNVGDRTTKPPHSALTGSAVNVNKPASWSGFEEALTACEAGDFDGVGLVLAADDDLVVIDLDDCRDPESGIVTPEADQLVWRLASYTEVSPSGRGLHIWLRGILPPGGRRTRGAEVYHDGGFATVTGNVLQSWPIRERQADLITWYFETFGAPAPPGKPSPDENESAPIARIDDRMVIDRALAGSGGENLRRLYVTGDPSRYPSPSEADLALVCGLARISQDASQLDRLFRSSGLMREKWERADYRERTIRAALEGLHEAGSENDDPPLPTDTAELQSVVLEERLRRQQAEARVVELERSHTGLVLVQGNRGLGQARTAAVALGRKFLSEESRTGRRRTDSVPIPLKWLAEMVGCSVDTAGAYLADLERAGLIVVTRRLVPGYVNPQTNKLVPTHSEINVRPKAGGALAFVEAAAKTVAPPRPQHPSTWGGMREPNCPDCPDASVRRTIATTIRYECEGCGQLIAESTHEQEVTRTPARRRASTPGDTTEAARGRDAAAGGGPATCGTLVTQGGKGGMEGQVVGPPHPTRTLRPDPGPASCPSPTPRIAGDFAVT